MVGVMVHLMYSDKKPNRLINEKSPYLLQHANNPVSWYPWGIEAFEKARVEDKPIFLSIGYSTCHWCHVMETESFEDELVAKLLNRNFVCIKVDREERPDIDNVYMTVCQVMTGRGGWPLSIIMTPDKKPFFAATYIPKESRFGLIGMLDLIPKIRELWMIRKDEVLNSAVQISDALQTFSKGSGGEELDESILRNGYKELMSQFDSNHGGFGIAPKFPTPHYLLFLLRYWKRSGEEKALHMVEKTLKAMRHGGVWDHVGFGFHRYSTDQFWIVPHFEKMLYDQATMILAYTEAFQATGKAEYKETVDQIFKYISRSLTHSEGGFYSAEDADSEGEEGKYYLWTESEIKDVLGSEAELMIKVFNVSKEGNFSDEVRGIRTGKNIVHLKKPIPDLAGEFDISQEELIERLGKAQNKLFEKREERVHPGKDDKILTDWNGLMIAALAKAARVFGGDEYKKAAERAAEFILKRLVLDRERIIHRYRDGEAAITGFLDDYVFFIWGLIELYETTFNVKYLNRALEFTQYMITHFWDDDDGGFYSTSDEAEKLFVRQKISYDGAIPSGISVAMLNLLRLARITGNSDLENKVLAIGKAFSNDLNNSPYSHIQFLVALDFVFGPSFEVVIVGNFDSEDTNDILSALRNNYIPNKVVLFRSITEKSQSIDSLSPYTSKMAAIDDKATVYVCHNYSCELPTNDKDKMLERLNLNKRNL